MQGPSRRCVSRIKDGLLASTSPEHRTFVKHSNKLQKALNCAVLTSLAWDLYSEEVLSREAVENSTNEMLGAGTRASKLLVQMGGLIDANHSNFHILVRCCDKYAELKHIVQSMREMLQYKMLKKKSLKDFLGEIDPKTG